MSKPPSTFHLPPSTSPRVAIVHDWLVGGGAEKVVLELHRMFPEAPIYTSYCTPEWRKKLDYMVITGPLQAWPFSRLRKFIPFLRIWWFTSLKFNDYDLVISSSGAEAKGIKIRRSKPPSTFHLPPSKPLHVAYIHAPTHYYWSRYEEYLKNPGFGAFNWLAKLGLRLLVGPLRRWDYTAAQRPDYIIANSVHTQSAIKKYYDRDSEVIHPPVQIERFQGTSSSIRKGFVVISRQVPYKRIDLAVKACSALNLELTVIGNGPQHSDLQKFAGPTVKFIPRASDEEIEQALASAEAFIFPGVEDFGIAPVEALAAGTPVIAYKAGGALDFVTPQTGLFFEQQTAESLVNTLKNFNSSSFSENEIKKAAAEFSPDKFRKSMEKIIDNSLSKRAKT